MRAARMNTAQEHREVAHIDVEFLLEVQQELRPGGVTIVDVRPGPVVLPVHDGEEILLEFLDLGDGERHDDSFRTRGARACGPGIMVPARREIKRLRPCPGERTALRPAPGRPAAPRGPADPRGAVWAQAPPPRAGSENSRRRVPPRRRLRGPPRPPE